MIVLFKNMIIERCLKYIFGYRISSFIQFYGCTKIARQTYLPFPIVFKLFGQMEPLRRRSSKRL